MPRPTPLTRADFDRQGAARFLATGLRAHMERFEAALGRLASHPSDVEAVHDVRVATRRLTGILEAASDWLPRKPARRVIRRLKRLRSALGGAREADVGAGRLRDLQSTLPEELRPSAAGLAASLVRRRETASGGAADAAPGVPKPRRLARLTARLHRLAGALEAAPSPGEDFDAFRGHALRVLHGRWNLLREAPRRPLDDLDDDAQHRFRINGKKLRYALELFAPIFSPKIESRLRLLREVQDQLGDIHDLADLAAEARGLGDAAARAGFADASHYHRLAALLDDRRRARYEGFAARHAGLVHPGFLPSLPAEVAPVAQDAGAMGGEDANTVPEASAGEAPAAPRIPADASPGDTRESPASPHRPLRIVGGDTTETDES